MDVQKIDWLLNNGDVEVKNAIQELISKINGLADNVFKDANTDVQLLAEPDGQDSRCHVPSADDQFLHVMDQPSIADDGIRNDLLDIEMADMFEDVNPDEQLLIEPQPHDSSSHVPITDGQLLYVLDQLSIADGVFQDDLLDIERTDCDDPAIQSFTSVDTQPSYTTISYQENGVEDNASLVNGGGQIENVTELDLPVIYNVEEDGSCEIYELVCEDGDLMDVNGGYVACCQLNDIFDNLIQSTDNTADSADENDLETVLSQSLTPFVDPSKSSSITEKSHKGSCDNTIMVVQTSDCPQKEKKYCCLYCHKLCTKLPRHLETIHKTEPDVQKFAVLPKGSRERREIQDCLRKKGTFIFNTNENLNQGVLMVSRRPDISLNKTASDYTICFHCIGTYTKSNIRHHVAKCTKKPLNGQRTVSVLGRAVEGRIHADASDRLRLVVFPVLREDHVVRLIRYDWILIIYGNKLCVKYTPSYQHNMIRARLRLAGRVLFALRSLNSEVTDYSSIFNPRMYDALIEAIRIVAQFDPMSDEFKSPATAAFAVTQIKQIGLILTAEYIKKEEPDKQKRVENFLTLFRSDVGTTINKTVTETQARMRREKIQNVPTTDDVKRLSQFLDRERKLAFTELKNDFSYKAWVKLSHYTMASIIVYNRRRTGETQNILVNNFLKRESIDEKSNLEMFSSLSEHAKELAKKYSRLKIRGKKNRDVHVLLKPGLDECMKLLLQHRTNAGIPENNKYFFALPSSNEFIPRVVDACNLLRKFSTMCGAADPLTLRGTTLRKHIASMCISLELNDSLVSEVANFMGHHEKIHRDVYRLNTIDREIVKMSELLEQAQGHDDDDDDDDDESYESPEYETGIEDIEGGTEVETGIDDIQDMEGDMQVEIPSTSSGTYNEEGLQPIQPKTPTPTQLNRKRKIETHVIESLDDGGSIAKKKFSKKRWTQDELSAVRTAFASYFQSKTLPSTTEIKMKQDLHTALQNRTWEQIKTWISNENKKATSSRKKFF